MSHNKNGSNNKFTIVGLLTFTLFFQIGCTPQLKDSFRFFQQEERFTTVSSVNTKVDLLFVVDNSASMDASQEKLRNGFEAFARKYLKPTWDIQVAVITTDVYLANAAFQNYLNKKVSGSTGYQSDHILNQFVNSGDRDYVNPTWNTSLVNLSTATFDQGFLYKELVPQWGSDYAQLKVGIHDGPIVGLCIEAMAHFFKGVTECLRRDLGTQSGISSCIQPNASAGETSMNQCVNTVQNNTVHSGKAIIKTKPGAGVSADEAWTQQLIQDFMVNVTTGSVGQGSERGFSSLLQFLSDNEDKETTFFRQGSLRGIIFVSDEDDQSLEIPTSPSVNFSPETDYKCNLSQLQDLNPGKNLSSICCADGSCQYGAAGLTCPSKQVDNKTYQLSICPDENQLITVASVKNDLDTFFNNLDSGISDSEGYFAVSIVPLTSTDIDDLQATRDGYDQTVGALKTIAVDQGTRYLELVSQVANGSFSMSINEGDYSSILNKIGQTILEKKGSFALRVRPTGKEDMIVAVLRANGQTTFLTNQDYQIVNNKIKFSDLDFVLSLEPEDVVLVNYQPAEAIQ